MVRDGDLDIDLMKGNMNYGSNVMKDIQNLSSES